MKSISDRAVGIDSPKEESETHGLKRDLVTNWIWSRKETTHTFLVCSSKNITLLGPTEGNTYGKRSILGMEDNK